MKSLKIFSLVIFFYLSQNTYGQFIKTFNNTPGQDVRFGALVSVSDSPESNLYIAGFSEGFMLIGEIDQIGDFVWTTKINVKDTNMVINQMIRDSEGNLVLVGTAIAGDLGKSFIMKFDPNTNAIKWFRRCTTNTFFWDVAELGPGGDYIVGGQETTTGGGVGTNDVTIKFKRLSGAWDIVTNLDKNLNESVEAILYDDESNSIYSTGRYELSTGGTGKFRMCINKFDIMGNVDWTRAYIKSNTGSGRFYSEDILKDGDNLIVVGAGDDAGTSSNKNLWFVKTDLSGEASITKKYDVVGTTTDGLFASIKKHTDGYIIYGSLYAGGFYTDVFLFNVNFDGDINWAKSYPFRTRYPTTGLFNSGAMAVIGENIFVVGEQVSDAGIIQGVFMSTSVSSGDLSDCDNDISCLVTNISNYDAFETLDSFDVSLSFPSSFPARIDITLGENLSCANIGDLDGSEFRKNAPVKEEELTSNTLNIFPNPSSQIVCFEFQSENFTTGYLNIFDINGKIIKTSAVSKGATCLDFKFTSGGIYTGILYDNNNMELSSNKFILDK
jgi:hypothetical protein